MPKLPEHDSSIITSENEKSQKITIDNTNITKYKAQNFDAHALVVVKKVLGGILLQNFATRSVRTGTHNLPQDNQATRVEVPCCNRVLTMTSSKSMIV